MGLVNDISINEVNEIANEISINQVYMTGKRYFD